MWDAQVEALKHDYRVVRYDTRGHGNSAVPEGDYRLEDLLDDLLGLLDSLKLERIHFVGLSLGGMIGQLLAIHHSDRVHSLFLCDTASEMPPGIWDARIAKARREGMEPLLDGTIERWFTADFREKEPAFVDKVRTMVAATPPQGYAACATAIKELATTPLLEKIAVPTCILVGADDPSTPVEASEKLHRGIANSELKIIPHAAHLANLEQPTAVNAELNRFLSAQSGAPG